MSMLIVKSWENMISTRKCVSWSNWYKWRAIIIWLYYLSMLYVDSNVCTEVHTTAIHWYTLYVLRMPYAVEYWMYINYKLCKSNMPPHHILYML